MTQRQVVRDQVTEATTDQPQEGTLTPTGEEAAIRDEVLELQNQQNIFALAIQMIAEKKIISPNHKKAKKWLSDGIQEPGE